MEMVALAEVAPGRRLARPVTNSAGAVLCPAGTALTPALIEKLVNAGIDGVYVHGGGRQGLGVQERMDNLRKRFAGVTDPALLELKKIVETRLEAMAAQESGDAGAQGS